MVKKKRWVSVPLDKIDMSQFSIPDKKKRPLAIISPPVSASATTNSEKENEKPVVHTPASTSRGGSTSAPTPPAKKHLATKPTIAEPTIDAADSQLDIYARKYVPYWLRAVNESFAVKIHAQPLQHIDTAQYAITFMGSDFLEAQPSNALPPAEACHLPRQDLAPVTYRHHWHARLQNELAAQTKQYDGFSLYNVSIRIYNAERHLFQFRVPGLREYNPRIDLGDRILIRPLVPVLESVIGKEAQDWSVRRDGIAPGFNGNEHHATVWSVLRRDEVVIVALAHNIPSPTRCNVVFPLQHHKCIPSWQAVSVIESRFNSPFSGRSWLTKMLFPQPAHGEIQSKLAKADFTVPWVDQTLNLEQKRAVQAICDNQYGEVPFLISGPPGTGKTKTIVESALQLLKSQRDHVAHLLICAPSDSAADTLLVRLSAHLKPGALFRLNNWTRLLSEVPGEVRPYCFIDKNQVHSLPPFEIFMAARVVVSTCRDAHLLLTAGLTNHSLSLMTTRLLRAVSKENVDDSKIRHWTALLVDEAAQATEPEIGIPLSVVSPLNASDAATGPQFILAGDEYQLGPWLSNTRKDSELGVFDTDGLEISLFQRLFERPLYNNHPLSRKNGMPPITRKMLPMIRPPFANLVRNYRSHPAILATSSSLFYFDTLLPQRQRLSPVVASWERWPKSTAHTWPVLFHEHQGQDAVESVTEGDGTGAGSLTNLDEVRIAFDHVQHLLSHAQRLESKSLVQQDIIVMAPYRAQVNLLRKFFRDRGLHDVRIGPLEAFQGLESRVVVLCTTRTRLGSSAVGKAKYVTEDRKRNLGIVDAPKIFNVSMTRAKEALMVIGNSTTLTSTNDGCWMSFLAFCSRNGLFFTSNASFTSPDSSITKSKLEAALNYADHQLIHGETGRGVPLGDTNGNVQDLDHQMNQLHVSEEDEMLIRAEEDEDDGVEAVSAESEDLDDGDPRWAKNVDELVNEDV